MHCPRIFRLTGILLCITCTHLFARIEERVETWDQVAGSISGQFIRLQLPDGTDLRGIGIGTDGDFLSMNVTRSSNHNLHPRGRARIARAEVSTIDVRLRKHAGHSGAALGTAIGLAVSAPVAFVAGSKTNGGVAVLVLAAGAVVGWSLGRHLDTSATAHFRIVVRR